MFIDVFSAVNHIDCTFILKFYLKYGFPKYIKGLSLRPYRFTIISHELTVYKSSEHMLIFNLLYRTTFVFLIIYFILYFSNQCNLYTTKHGESLQLLRWRFNPCALSEVHARQTELSTTRPWPNFNRGFSLNTYFYIILLNTSCCYA